MPRCAKCKKVLEDCGCDGPQGVLKPSVFSTALVGLLDGTDWFSRTEWAEFFGVPTNLLDAWEKDEVFPRADFLRILLDLLNNSAGIPKKPLDEFQALMVLPIEEISPCGPALQCKTLKEYLARDLRRAKRISQMG